jgi:hypothetical protein
MHLEEHIQILSDHAVNQGSIYCMTSRSVGSFLVLAVMDV